jgi:hypothetical protein
MKDKTPVKPKKRERGWGRIVFQFKTEKAAFAMGRWLLFGKEMGVIPASIELQLGGKTLTIGHYTE